MICHSPNGWSTANLMKSYVKWLSERNQGRKCHLIWDLHSSHRDAEVKAYSVEKGINLQYVPAGQTGFWQPLDKGLFGAVKARAKSEFDKLVLQSGAGSEADIDIFDALHILHRIWKEIPSSDVSSCWSVLIGDQVSEDKYESQDDEYESQDDE